MGAVPFEKTWLHKHIPDSDVSLNGFAMITERLQIQHHSIIVIMSGDSPRSYPYLTSLLSVRWERTGDWLFCVFWIFKCQWCLHVCWADQTTTSFIPCPLYKAIIQQQVRMRSLEVYWIPDGLIWGHRLGCTLWITWVNSGLISSQAEEESVHGKIQGKSKAGAEKGELQVKNNKRIIVIKGRCRRTS